MKIRYRVFGKNTGEYFKDARPWGISPIGNLFRFRGKTQQEFYITELDSGLTDEKGGSIFEGDVLYSRDTMVGYVVFEDGAFRVGQDNGETKSVLCQRRTKLLRVGANINLQ